MTISSLDAWIRAVRSSWGPLSTRLVEECRHYLERLASTPLDEEWMAELQRERPATRQLYRDPDHGFMLLAHTEHAGLYRPPHDHGRSWVMYGVREGAVEMGTYGRTSGPDGKDRLVRRNSTSVSAGQVQVYLPGDIHDTRCVAGPALLFRFTERDLRLEKEQHRITRYTDRDGAWLTEAA